MFRSARPSPFVLAKDGVLASDDALQLEENTKVRNAVVHQPETVQPIALREWLPEISALANRYAGDAR
jgi:uncharacterized protein YutE (UPF0331/DUF86 family)